MSQRPDKELSAFAEQNKLTGLRPTSLVAIRDKHEGYTVERGRKFLSFQKRIDTELLTHRVITDNRFTKWFQKGEMSLDQVKAFVVQFSVFSNQFLIAQLKKTINADSIDGMRASKEILANEIGVIFRSTEPRGGPAPADKDREGDPDLVSTEGTVDGGIFRFRAAHFEWLLRMGEKLGMGFNDMGKRRHGIPSTLFFCDELERIYGSEDYATGQAASYSVENWAKAGFWQELVDGFTIFKKRELPDLPLAFWTYHNMLEQQHADHTQDELEEYYFGRELDEDKFIKDGGEMLSGVAAFWDGLDEQRKKIS